MTKKELRKKLLAAGLAEDVVDERLKDVSDERLKELSDIPEAVLLKELELDKEDDTPSGDEQVFVLDPEVLKEFRTIVREEVKGLLDGLQIDIPEVEFELKELEQVSELLTIVKELKEAVDELTESDEKRLKSILEDAPRSARLRIRRYKTSKGKDGDGEDDEEDDEGKPKPPMEKKERIPLSDGTFVSSMTEAVMGTAGGD